MADDQNGAGLSRRQFIKSTAGTTAGVVAGSVLAREAGAAARSQTAQSAGRVLGANDRINFAIIGTKPRGMGFGHLRNLIGPLATENVQVVAVCDVWQKARELGQAEAKLTEGAAFNDYRKMLDTVKEIDAVLVATPDHWHAEQAIAALALGKHVYVEKPMTRTLDEGFKLYEAATRSGKLVQVGPHGCSDPKWLRAREIVAEGRMGRLLWAQASYCRNNPTGEWNYELDPDATEQTIDWKTWLGDAPKRPFSAERYFRWRKYWDYGTGLIGDLWPHRLYPLMLAMNISEFPRSVSCLGDNLCNTDAGPDANGQPYGEPREVADTTMMMVDFPSGVMIFAASATTNERGIDDVIRGQKANLMAGGNRLMVTPERPFVEEVEATDETPVDAGESHVKHMSNFILSMRNNVQPNCGIELGIRGQAIVSMAEMAYRKKKLVTFDEATRRMT